MGLGVASEAGTRAFQKKPQGETGPNYVGGRVVHSYVWPVTGKRMHDRAGLCYVDSASIKLLNKRPALATFGAYDNGLEGH